jgi:two-component system, NtrC family, nitrogen regulation sensor histidine kinase NtrY
MVYRQFYVNVVVRVLFLTVNCMVFAFAWYGKGNYIALFNLGLLILIQTMLFIHFGNRTNRDLSYFFDSVKNEDAGISFNRSRKKFRGIYQSMDKVNSQIKTMRMKYAAQDQYFKTIVESIQTGLISFGPDGKVDLLNKAVKNMLGIKAVHKIDTLNTYQKGLGDTLREINPSEKQLFRVNTGSETVLLSINSTVLKLVDKELKIITFHDINQEINKNEQESWQKLIRILNHEIMNSLAPIISTATTLKGFLSEQNAGEHSVLYQNWDRVLKKTISGLSIIHERSEGLKSFVEKYRMLNMLPQPVITIFKIRELIDNCKELLSETLQACHIHCTSEIAVPGMELSADKSQIQQILINLLKNSIESLSETTIKNKFIRLKAFSNERGKAVLQVCDNGKGIPPENIDQIFIPFFTTKEKGSGIGLSLSRQIMHLHHGTMSVYSVPNQETVLTLTF